MLSLSFSRVASPVALLIALPLILANTATPDQIAKARSILDHGLRDYDHARLRDLRLVERTMDAGHVDPYKTGVNLYGPAVGDHIVAICGEMNAPNATGGMTSWHKVGIVIQGRAYDPLPTDEHLGALTAFCGDLRALPPVDPELTAALQPVPIGQNQ